QRIGGVGFRVLCVRGERAAGAMLSRPVGARTAKGRESMPGRTLHLTAIPSNSLSRSPPRECPQPARGDTGPTTHGPCLPAQAGPVAFRLPERQPSHHETPPALFGLDPLSAPGAP